MELANKRKVVIETHAPGESVDAGALPKLAELICSDSPLVRSVAASDMGNLAGILDCAASVDLQHPCLSDAHPQVRQFAAKEPNALGAAAGGALDELGGMCQNHTDNDYVRLGVPASDKTIREALKIGEKTVLHRRSRCGQQIGMPENQELYPHAGNRLISLYIREKTILCAALRQKPSFY
ncbi:MAG: armadillo/beta-catenin-like repeat-containing protein [Kiritimatiellae bacterium]|nr:armadillo/beta-catenin-like repeat-containing protein [Kiritimatiellia bacterium]